MWESWASSLSSLANTNTWFFNQNSPEVGSSQFKKASRLQNSNLNYLLYCKLKWHNQANRRVGVGKGFPCKSVKLVLLANGNTWEVDSNTFFLSVKALYPYKLLPCMGSELLWHTFASVTCARFRPNINCTARRRVHTGDTGHKIYRKGKSAIVSSTHSPNANENKNNSKNHNGLRKNW